MPTGSVQAGGALQGLAVHRDDPPPGPGGGVVPVGEVGAHRPVQRVAVDGPQDPPDRRGRRCIPPPQRMPPHPQGPQQLARGPRTPLGELVAAPRARHDRAGAHQQDGRQ